MRLKLHRFGATYNRGKHTIKPNFDNEESDTSKRGYTFSVDLDVKTQPDNLSFKQRYNTLTKLNALNKNKTHKQMQKNNLEVWDYCPDCIKKIKKELGL